MITLVTDNPNCCGCFGRASDGRFIYKLSFIVGKNDLESEWRACPADASPEVLESFERATEAQRAVSSLIEAYPTEMKLMLRCPKGPDGQRSFSIYDETWHKLLRQLESAYETSKREQASLTNELISLVRKSDRVFQLTRESGSETAVKYAYCKGRIWSSRITLDYDQWLALVERTLDHERSVLLRLTSTRCGPEKTRVIPVDVRREVWRRDDGRCTSCGSQERLEFDHMVPVTMGGSNTVRNVQLLCEACNRKKGATLG